MPRWLARHRAVVADRPQSGHLEAGQQRPGLDRYQTMSAAALEPISSAACLRDLVARSRHSGSMITSNCLNSSRSSAGASISLISSIGTSHSLEPSRSAK